MSTAAAKDSAVSRQAQEQAARSDDAQRFCGDATPDVEEVIAGMIPKKAQVSAQCAVLHEVRN